MKETDSINYRIAYSVFSLFNKVAIVVRSVADFVRKKSAETSHCLAVRDFYVVIVCTLRSPMEMLRSQVQTSRTVSANA